LTRKNYLQLNNLFLAVQTSISLHWIFKILYWGLNHSLFCIIHQAHFLYVKRYLVVGHPDSCRGGKWWRKRPPAGGLLSKPPRNVGAQPTAKARSV